MTFEEPEECVVFLFYLIWFAYFAIYFSTELYQIWWFLTFKKHLHTHFGEMEFMFLKLRYNIDEGQIQYSTITKELRILEDLEHVWFLSELFALYGVPLQEAHERGIFLICVLYIYINDISDPQWTKHNFSKFFSLVDERFPLKDMIEL
ncbi:hypothetical protein ACJX0J_032846 [Zea mays]